jgi:hypothetical protein
MKINTCKVCGAEFEAVVPQNKICSDECREVQKVRSREKWRTQSTSHKKRWSGYSKAYRERFPFRAKVTAFRTKAAQLDLPFDLDESWFIENQGTHCPVLGIKYTTNHRDSQASVDRLIPERGYTKDNCRIISMKANRLKNNATVEELKKIIAYIENSS